jgi:hypothetical protein
MENSIQSWHNRLVLLRSLDHLVRSIQHRLRNGHADLLSRLQIDHQLEFRRLPHRHIGRLGSLQDSVYVSGDAPVTWLSEAHFDMRHTLILLDQVSR